MTTLKFGPLPRRGIDIDWSEIADQLRARPGEWAIVRSADKSKRSTMASNASNIQRGALAQFRPPRSFQAATRIVDGQACLYARYVGEQS